MIKVSASEITEPILQMCSIKDPHMNFGFANRIRYDHQLDLSNKLNFLNNWAKQNNVQDLIMTGDVTDTNEEKKWSFNQYVTNKDELLKFKENNITLWSPAGNHDMFNGLNQTTKTVFGEFVREEVINYLTTKPLYKSFKTPTGVIKNIMVYGVDYSKHKELVQAKLSEINQVVNNGLKIVVFHSHCTPSEIAITDFTYEELVKTYNDIDVFICGHYHGGFPTYTFFKKDSSGKDTSSHVTIINNWSFQRVVRDYYNEMDIHTPEFEHIKIGWSHSTGDFIISTETIKVPCKKYEDAFKPKAIELLKLTRKEQFEFFEKINFNDLPTGTDDEESLKIISLKEGYTPEIISKALYYLNNVRVEDLETDGL